MLKSANKKEPENAEKFNCESCGFLCSKKSNFNKHLLTLKHLNANNANNHANNNNAIVNNKYICSICSHIFNHASSLSRHKKKCNKLNDNDKNENDKNDKNDKNENDKNDPNKINDQDETISSDKKLINMLIKENADFKNMFQTILFDVVKSNKDIQLQMLDAVKQTNTNNTINNTNNSHNKTFNLQFFLNEQCKDAMNIMDFVNSVTLQFSDLESVGKLGYVEGISNIMIKKLNEMDVYKRPVHCSDAKRETLYVKDNDIWEKENASHSKLRRAIKYISKKNSDLLIAWSNQHPASKNIHSKQNEEYMKMIHQAMGGVGDVEENENKIIKRISKMVLIDKV